MKTQRNRNLEESVRDLEDQTREKAFKRRRSRRRERERERTGDGGEVIFNQRTRETFLDLKKRLKTVD